MFLPILVYDFLGHSLSSQGAKYLCKFTLLFFHTMHSVFFIFVLRLLVLSPGWLPSHVLRLADLHLSQYENHQISLESRWLTS